MQPSSHRRSETERAGRLPGASLLLSAAALAVFLVPGAARLLEYDRSALAAGELWRLVTCHWTHWGAEHLIWDMVVFALLGAACEGRSRRRLWLGLALSALLVPAAVWLVIPGMERYRGLSGLDSMLFALLATEVLREKLAAGRRLWALAAAAAALAFAGKIAWELATGTAVFVDSSAAGMVPVPLAHLVGAACGALAGMAPMAPPLAQPDEATRIHPKTW
ncbi:MAG TPA: rhombosortase [Planctomycetota bacterium]|nr:rhombosortase [Planctomycetota bacterium]